MSIALHEAMAWNPRPIRMQDRVIWIVALGAIAQGILQAFDARLQGSWTRFALWLVGSIGIAALAAWGESVKGIGGQA